MKKKNRPAWYEHTKVYCDGILILTISSTVPIMRIDIWSGTHPAYKKKEFGETNPDKINTSDAYFARYN